MALIKMAIREDLGHASYGTVQGDKTVELAIPQELSGIAHIISRRPGVIAGTYLLGPILREYQVNMACEIFTPDGTRVEPNQPVAKISGAVGTILSAERVLLNFLGHLSGIATLTRRYVDAVAPVARETGKPLICDIRKTTPAFRQLDKYAVRCGGGVNHRMGLYDGVILKDNHLAALREKLGKGMTLAQLTRNIRAKLAPEFTLWLEVDTLDQLREELDGQGARGGADIIIIDNFTPDQMRQAVKLRDRKTQDSGLKTPLLEASGGITLDNILPVAQTGVDRISIGALTHSAPVLDLSMEFDA
jgi:nicotinate-nucleotide pyrophosphorylase (carboxylating)